MVTYVNNDEKILPADGFPDDSFSFPASEAGAGSIHKITVFNIPLESGIVVSCIFHIFPEFNKIIVDASSDGFCGFHGKHLKRRYRKGVFQFSYVWHMVLLSVCLGRRFLFFRSGNITYFITLC